MLMRIRKRLKAFKKDEKGFTLIELMVVVVIIGIMAAVLIPQFTKSAEKAKMGRAKADMANFRTVLAIVYAEEGKYPTSASDAWKKMHDNGIPGSGTDPNKDPWNSNYSYSGSDDDYTITDSKGQEATPDGVEE